MEDNRSGEVPLQGEVILLRPWQVEDASWYVEARDEEIFRWPNVPVSARRRLWKKNVLTITSGLRGSGSENVRSPHPLNQLKHRPCDFPRIDQHVKGKAQPSEKKASPLLDLRRVFASAERQRRAGRAHRSRILGSAQVLVEVDRAAAPTRVLFTGDLGRKGLPILREAYAHPCESLDEIKTHVLCQAGVGSAELVRGE